MHRGRNLSMAVRNHGLAEGSKEIMEGPGSGLSQLKQRGQDPWQGQNWHAGHNLPTSQTCASDGQPYLPKRVCHDANTQQGFAPENQEKESSFTTLLLNALHFSSHHCFPLIFEAHCVLGTMLAARAVTNLDFTIERVSLHWGERWEQTMTVQGI